MIYKQRNLLSFVLVSIVERAREMFSILFNATSCKDQSKDQCQHREIPNADTEVRPLTLCMLHSIKFLCIILMRSKVCFRNLKIVF